MEVPLYCDLCSKDFSGAIPAQQHFISEAHRRKEDQKKNSVFQSSTKPYWCDPCHLQCNSADQFTQHIASPRHREIVNRAFHISKQVNYVAQESQLRNHIQRPTVGMNNPGLQLSGTTLKKKEYDFDGNRGYCYVCEIDLTSQQHARQHLNGSKHQKKIRQSNEGEHALLYCSICDVPFSCSRNAQEHLASGKHLRRKQELETQECFADGNFLHLGPQNVDHKLNSSAVAQIPYPTSKEPQGLADVPVNSKMSSVSKKQSTKIGSTPLTSSITLVGASGHHNNIGANKLNSDVNVPYTFDGKQGYCNICQVDFTSPQNAEQHLDGSKHQKAEKTWKQGRESSQENMCNICNVVFSGPECAQQHYASQKHEKRSQLPVTNFTILQPEKPALAQKVNLTKTPPLTPNANIQTSLPLNIQPDSTRIFLRDAAESQSKASDSLFKIRQPNFEQLRSAISANSMPQGQDMVPSESLCLTVHGGSLPTPLAVDGSSQLHYPNSMNPMQVYSPDNFLAQSPRTVTNMQNINVEKDQEKEYRFDGNRGWCYVCNIELTSQQHANQHLSGRNHSKTLVKWKSSLTASARPLNSHMDMQNPTGTIKVQPAANHPYRFDGNRGWCNVCSIELTSSQHASQHLSGKNHAKALARWETENTAHEHPSQEAAESVTGARQPHEFNGERGFCHVCKIELTSEAHAREHLSGKPHKKAALRWNSPFGNLHELAGNNPDLSEQTSPSVQVRDEEEPAYYFTGSRGRCNVCNIELTSREHATQHLKGRNHTRAEERKKMVKRNGLFLLECKICFKSFSGQESAAQHFASAKHKNKAAMKTGCLSSSAFDLDQTGIIRDGGDSPRIIMSQGQSPVNPYMCEVCQCPLNSFEQLSIHKKSPSHLMTVEKMNRYIAVNMAAVAENLDIGSSGDSPNLIEETSHDQTVSKMDQYSDLWNAIKRGEITTVKSVAANAQPGEIVSFTSNKSGDVPITTSTNLNVAVTSGGQSTSEMTHSTLSNSSVTALKTSQRSNVDVMETGGSHNTECTGTTDVQPRASSVRFNPVVGSPLVLSATGEGLSTTTVSPVITTDALPPRIRTDIQVNIHDSETLSSPNDDHDTSEHQIASGVALKQVTHNPLRNKNNVKQRGNKVPLDSYEQLDSDEEDYRYIPDERDTESLISYVSGASNFLNDGAHASHTTDNNPSVSSATRRAGDLSLLSDAESSVYQSSNMDLLSGFSGVGPLPKKPLENPYKGHFKYYCEVCNRPMNTEKDYKLHLESRGHQQRVAVVQAPVRTDLGHITRVLTLDDALEEAYVVTSTMPRNYQVELFCKAMEDDRVIFLPTGTGKTLVSVMTLSCMLRLNPRRPVLFLVDKVLLVLQQSKYIVRELGEKRYKRLPLNGSYPDLHERKLKIATMCGNLLPADSTPLYQHDVIVTTAAYADNLLQKKFIHWTDFSLVVFDEAHHCVKKHPFNCLLAEYHRPCSPEMRPKVLGLTASPAGRDNVENTYTMLKELFANLGGARVAIVQRESELQELAKYQSNASLDINYKPYSEEERDFRLKLREYLRQCYLKLAEISNLEIENNWDMRKMQRVGLAEFAENLDRAAEERFLSVLDTLKPRSKEPAFKAVFDFLTKHSKIVILALSDMDGCGIPGAVADLQILATSQSDSGFHHAKTLGLPCDGLEEALKRSAHSAQIHRELEDNPLHISLYNQLFQTLTNTDYINWKSEDHPMALILVRERAHAHRLSNFLKQSQFAAGNDLKITSVVGHGSGQADGGMKVKQQKRVLDGVKRKRYHIIVATSVAEEGVDIPECELVVCMNPPSTVTGLVQMRGRARKKGSYFVILCKSKDEKDQMTNLLERETFMMEAAKLCIQQGNEQ